jgi:asparagine synthase (glutamine-hydrolysing)
MILACRPDSADVVAYTFASTSDTVDVQIAARVAAAAGVPHHIIRLDHDFFANFASLVDRTIYVSDGCSGVSGGHEIYLHEKARELAPVRLTGNYGSEILRGVTTLKPLGLSERLFHPDLMRSVSDTRNTPRRGGLHAVSCAAFEEIPWQLFGPFRAAQSQLTIRTPYLDNDIVTLAFRSSMRLKTSSWPAMQVIRHNAPALSRIITDTGLVPSSPALSLITRPWYRATFKVDYWRTVELPRLLSPIYPLLSRVPIDHSALPEHRFLHYRRWFRFELAEYVREQLNDPRVLNNPLWNRRFIEHMAENHISGRANHLREIDMVLTCAAVDRLLLGGDV